MPSRSVDFTVGIVPPIGDPSHRDPTVYDDAWRGNVVDRLWLNLTSGEFFRCSDVTLSAAVWTSEGTPTALPGDAAPGGLLFYGTKPLTAAWANGQLFRIKRQSDNATQIISAVSGVTDIATINSFLATSVGKIDKFFDQSGNGNDTGVLNFADAPYLRVEGSRVFWIYDHYSSKFDTIRFITLPNVAWGTDFSVFSQLALTNCTHGEMAIFEFGSDSNNFQGWYNSHHNSWADQSRSYLSVAASSADTNPTIFSFITSSTAATAYWAERSITSQFFKTKGSPVGGFVGKTTVQTGGPFHHDAAMQAFCVWGSALSDANALLVRKAFYQWGGTVPQASNDVIVTVGDIEQSPAVSFWPEFSQTNRGGAGYGPIYQARGLLNRPCREVNTAINGWRLQDMNSVYTNDTAPLFDVNAAHNIVILDGGINDGHVSADTPAMALSRLQTLTSSMKATGFRVYYITMFSFGSVFDIASGYTDADQWRLDFDARVRTAFAAGDLDVEALLDLGATSTAVGAVHAYSDTTVFNEDTQHWKANGMAIAASPPYIPTHVNAELARPFDFSERWNFLKLSGSEAGYLFLEGDMATRWPALRLGGDEL